jgi:hypothetical protein
MRNTILAVIVGILFAGCTNESDTIRTLQNAGFSNVNVTGYSWFECGQDDTFHTGFEATNPTGMRVSGTVCCGFLGKGCTIRF